MNEFDDRFYRPNKEQLKKIVPKIIKPGLNLKLIINTLKQYYAERRKSKTKAVQ